MMGHNICLYEEIWLIIPKLSLLSLLNWSIVSDDNSEKITIKSHLTRISQNTLCGHKGRLYCFTKLNEKT